MFDTYKNDKLNIHLLPAPASRRAIIRSKITPFHRPADWTRPHITRPTQRRKIINLATASLSEADKWFHCRVMYEMILKLSVCWNCPVDYFVSVDSIFYLYASCDWTCPRTGVQHSTHTPLSIEFCTPVWRGGRLALSNMRPVYNGFLPGEYRWTGYETRRGVAA